MPAPRFRLLWFALAAVICFLAVLGTRGGRAPLAKEPGVPITAPSTTATTTQPPTPSVAASAAPIPADAFPPGPDRLTAPSLLAESTVDWIASRFPESEVLEQRSTPPDAQGRYERSILLRSHFKYPLVEVDEILRQDPAATAPNVEKREALVADHFLVKPRSAQSAVAIEAAVTQAGGWMDHALLAESGVDVTHLSQAGLGSVKAAIAALDQPNGPAIYAEPDFLCFTAAVPNDPYFPAEKGLTNRTNANADINAEAGWNIATSAANVVVAVIDTGVRYTHQDLRGNMWRNPEMFPGDPFGANFVSDTGDPNDDNGHGTHVAGIIGARGDDGVGIAGVAWQVQIMALKFMNASGAGATSDAVRAFNYAVAKGAHVINCSWCNRSHSQTLRNAVSSANDAGIPVVCAAGNGGYDNDVRSVYPACYKLPNVISVGSLDIDDLGASNFGATSVDLFAPGTNILSLSNTSDTAYTKLTGTSMAASFVSGVMALLRAQHPNNDVDWLRNRLLQTAAPMSKLLRDCVTSSRVDLYRCLAGIYLPPVEITNNYLVGSTDLGNSITLSVSSPGTRYVAYQWYHGAQKLNGQTSDTLTLSNLTLADAGSYSVVARSYTSSVRSKPFRIQVETSPPTALQPPDSATVLAGAPVTFQANFSGALPMSFQWECNGIPIKGATNAVFTFSAAPNQSGEYRVLAKNAYGSAHSGAAQLSVTSHALEQWMTLNPAPPNVIYSKVAFLNGQFVAVGDGGVICVSPDGKNWQLTPSVTLNALSSVAFGAGLYVAVGAGVVLTSPDAITWTPVPTEQDVFLSDITYGGGKFLAVGNGLAISSTDGVSWTAAPIGSSTPVFYARSIAFGNGCYIASGFLYDRNFELHDPYLHLYLSTDGIAWTVCDGPSQGYSRFVSLCFAEGKFWSCTDGMVYSSVDGTSWVSVVDVSSFVLSILPIGNAIYAIENTSYGCDLDVFSLDANVAGRVQYSFYDTKVTHIAAGDGRFAVCGEYAASFYYGDGSDFHPSDHFTWRSLGGATFGNGQFLVVDITGAFYSSSDGMNWRPLSTLYGMSGPPVALAFGNGVFVLSDGHSIWTSTDGVDWKIDSTLEPHLYRDAPINFVGGYFWLSENYLYNWNSVDGVHWTSTGNTATAYGNGVWLIPEYLNRIQTSRDGTNWYDVYLKDVGPICYAKGVFYMLQYAGQRLSVGANLPGQAEEVMGFDADEELSQLVYQDGIFVAVGEHGLYASLDAIRWAKKSTFAGAYPGVQLVQAPGMILAWDADTLQVAGHP